VCEVVDHGTMLARDDTARRRGRGPEEAYSARQAKPSISERRKGGKSSG
jgi:hypothetical protein